MQTKNTYEQTSTFELRMAVIGRERFYNRKQLGFARRLLNWLDYTSPSTDLIEYLDFLHEKGLTTYRMETKFIFDICKTLQITEDPFVRQYYTTLLPSQRCLSPNKLILLDEIYEALGKLSYSERWSLHFLGLSGRRCIDVSRMIPCRELDQPGVFYGRIPFDKKSATMSICEFRLSEAEFTSPSEFQELKRLFESGYTSNIDWSRIRRVTKLSLHKFRNRKCISLLLSGLSETEVMTRLGWKSVQSLNRYSFLSGNVLSRFGDIDSVVNFCRDQK